jgi:hypothetical protein
MVALTLKNGTGVKGKMKIHFSQGPFHCLIFDLIYVLF